MEVTLLAFVALFALLLLGLPIGFCMGIVGVAGFAILTGVSPALSMLAQVTSDTGLNYGFSVLPQFLLMGNVIARSRLAEDLYGAAQRFLGHLPGGLAHATIVACGGFSAVCGSSLATAATMAKISIPPMRRHGYDDSLAAGSVAAGGTLGSLIPPSIGFVIYGLITENDIGKLFMAGIIPGILGIFGYMAAIAVWTRLNPGLAPPVERASWRDRFHALSGVWGILALFLLVIGGIYGGIFTPTEAAGIGAAGSIVIATATGSMSLQTLFEVLADTARTTAMLFFVLIGALVLTNFLNVGGLPNALLGFIEALDVAPIVVLIIILVIYLILGCFLDAMAMLLLTIPVFYPIIQNLGFDPIWFGVLVIVAIEVSLISPPFGMNIFVVRGVFSDIGTVTIFRGAIPFVVVDVIRLAILVAVPAISLFLPSLLGR